MIDVFGFDWDVWAVFMGRLMVAKIGMRLVRSHFSPTEAMEETWTTICG